MLLVGLKCIFFIHRHKNMCPVRVSRAHICLTKIWRFVGFEYSTSNYLSWSDCQDSLGSYKDSCNAEKKHSLIKLKNNLQGQKTKSHICSIHDLSYSLPLLFVEHVKLPNANQ